MVSNSGVHRIDSDTAHHKMLGVHFPDRVTAVQLENHTRLNSDGGDSLIGRAPGCGPGW